MNNKFLLRFALLFVLAASPLLSARAQDVPGTVKFPSGIDSTCSLIGANNMSRSTLNGAIMSSTTTITVVSTTTFPSCGVAIVDNEIFAYTGKTSTTFTGVVRAFDGTVAVSHLSGAAVRSVIAAAHHNTLIAAIIATQNRVKNLENSDLPTELIGKAITDATISGATIETPTITGPISGNPSISGDLAVSGTLTATNVIANLAGSTGIAGATGGVSNLASTTIAAATAGGAGSVDLQTNGVSRLRVDQTGQFYGTKNITGVLNLREYGATGDDVANDSTALQSALNDLALLSTSQPAVLRIPVGTYKLPYAVSKSFSSLSSVVRIEGVGGKAVFHLASGTGTTNLSLTNAQSLTLSDVTFVGTPGATTDAKIGVNLGSNQITILNNVSFFGVATAEAGGAVLKVTGTDLSTRNLNFWGCTGYYVNTVSTMVVDSWRGVSMADTQFIDYGTLNNVAHSKTGTIGYAWLSIGTPAQDNEGVARISRLYADEGAAYAIVANASTNNAHIEIEGLNNNTNSTDLGNGIAINGFKYAKVSNSKFKTLNVNPNPRQLVAFTNVARAVVEGVTGLISAKKVFADSGTTSLTVRDSNFDTIESNATATRVETSTVTSFSGTSQFERHDAGKRIFGGTVLPTSYGTEFRSGGINVTGLPAVTGLTAAANVCCPGTTWTYYVIAVDSLGRRTTPASFVLTQGWAPGDLNLGGGAWHNISWTAVPGAASYLVFRSNTSTLLGSTTSTAWVDGGEAPSDAAYVANTINETAPVAVDGYVQATQFKIGALTWTVGAGAPSGSCVTGSTYSRTNGGTGATFYVCESSAWVAK